MSLGTSLTRSPYSERLPAVQPSFYFLTALFVITYFCSLFLTLNLITNSLLFILSVNHLSYNETTAQIACIFYSSFLFSTPFLVVVSFPLCAELYVKLDPAHSSPRGYL